MDCGGNGLPFMLPVAVASFGILVVPALVMGIRFALIVAIVRRGVLAATVVRA